MAVIVTTDVLTLAQTELFGIPTARLVLWMLMVLVLLLAVLLLVRLFRWIIRLVGKPTAATRSTQPAPQTQRTTPPQVTPITPVSPVEPSSALRSADSPITSTSSILDADLESPVETSRRVRITDRTNIADTATAPEYRAHSAHLEASRESQAFSGKERSWTNRSLFGQSLTGTQQDLPRIEPGQIPFSDTSDYQFGGVTPALAALLPESNSRKTALKQELMEAGYYNPHAYENLAAVRYLGLMLPLLVFGLLLVFGPPQLEPVMLALMVVGAIVGWSIPRLMIRSRAARRRKEIEQALPDVIDLLNMCVSQGMTLRSALARVSWEISDTYPAMAEELRIVAEQSDLGTIDHALTNMNARVNVPELHSLNSLLIQTERMGTNVSDSLTEYSDAMRATLQQRADQKANAATFKLLFPTVLCLMPAVYFFLLGPAVVELSDFFQSGGLDRYRQVQPRDSGVRR